MWSEQESAEESPVLGHTYIHLIASDRLPVSAEIRQQRLAPDGCPRKMVCNCVLRLPALAVKIV
jgi:hypothetical protein